MSGPVSGAGVPSSEAKVKRGDRLVGADTKLIERLGGEDRSGRRFQAVPQ